MALEISVSESVGITGRGNRWVSGRTHENVKQCGWMREWIGVWPCGTVDGWLGGGVDGWLGECTVG